MTLYQHISDSLLTRHTDNHKLPSFLNPSERPIKSNYLNIEHSSRFHGPEHSSVTTSDDVQIELSSKSKVKVMGTTWKNDACRVYVSTYIICIFDWTSEYIAPESGRLDSLPLTSKVLVR